MVESAVEFKDQSIGELIKLWRSGAISAFRKILQELQGQKSVDAIQAILAELAKSYGFIAEVKEFNEFVDALQSGRWDQILSEGADVMKLVGRWVSPKTPAGGGGMAQIIDLMAQKIPDHQSDAFVAAIGYAVVNHENDIAGKCHAFLDEYDSYNAATEGPNAEPKFVLELIAGIGLLINIVRFIRERRRPQA